MVKKLALRDLIPFTRLLLICLFILMPNSTRLKKNIFVCRMALSAGQLHESDPWRGGGEGNIEFSGDLRFNDDRAKDDGGWHDGLSHHLISHRLLAAPAAPPDNSTECPESPPRQSTRSTDESSSGSLLLPSARRSSRRSAASARQWQ